MRTLAIPKISVIFRFLVLPMAILSLVCLDPRIGFAGAGNLSVPLKWGAVQGSPAVTNPAGVGETNTRDVLWRRHERVSDNIYIPQANVTFRSAATQVVPAFPIIADPFPPGTALPSPPFPAGSLASGVLGDLIDPTVNPMELQLARQACAAAWAADPTLAGSGLFATNLRLFVDLLGVTSNFIGWSFFGAAFDHPAVVDNAFLLPTSAARIFTADPIDSLLGHELGHSLTLPHGNGIDDDGDGALDEDPPFQGNVGGDDDGDGVVDEDGPRNNANLMDPIAINAGQITPAQAAQMINEINTNVGGVTIDPPATFIPGAIRRDVLVDDVQEVKEPFVDIARVTVTANETADTVEVLIELFGLLPSDISDLSYYIVADLDNKKDTGGEPKTIKAPTDFSGAELVVRLDVEVKEDKTAITAKSWRFTNGFLREFDPRDFEPDITRAILVNGLAPPVPVMDAISVKFPRSVIKGATFPIRLEVLTHNPDTGTVDRLEGEVKLGRPVFPECFLDPDTAAPGATIQVKATGLMPENPAKVILGDRMVAVGETDPAGTLLTSFKIPARDVTAGPRLITVGTEDTAITADCLLTVELDEPPFRPEELDLLKSHEDLLRGQQRLLEGLGRLIEGVVTEEEMPRNRAFDLVEDHKRLLEQYSELLKGFEGLLQDIKE